MSLKSWVIGRQRRGLLSRVDLPPRDTQFEPGLTGETLPGARSAEPALPPAAHLGAYSPLIAAIRAELEHFIVSQLQLHLAIADRDRFVMTSIAVHCRGADTARERLRQFRREFKPEQIKRYLVREVIAGLPNAAALDMSQFAGLVDAEAETDGDDYADLLAELEGPAADAAEPVYEIELVGRWTENDGTAARAPASPVVQRAAAEPRPAHESRPAQAPLASTSTAAPLTPLAGGQRAEFEIDDAQGPRRFALSGVLPGRRYLVGQQPGCDIVVHGTYTSRRHAQLWFDSGGWWAADAGSTNGIRVDAGRDGGPAEAMADAGHPSADAAASAPLRLLPGAQLVLSARSEGPAADHPRLRLAAAPAFLTPIAGPLAALAPASSASGAAPAARAHQPAIVLSPIFPHRPAPEAPRTPPTPLTAVRGAVPEFVVRAPSGVLRPRIGELPLAIGRSRSQALVIERRHLGVSGRHLEIVGLDAEGLSLQVLGDNGVLLDGRHHRSGSRLHWAPGQVLVLGSAADEADACVMQLSRDSGTEGPAASQPDARGGA